ncbi:MAG: hypothetical protein ACM31E_11665, partial [Fibrobacterota bacterium]|nr:hypothetical protein [Chitinispirillaceae bacterium]
VAQIVNFLLLIWLLKKFLYKPILNAIDKREKHISEQLSLAESKKSDAAKELELYTNKNISFDNEKAVLFRKSSEQADLESKTIIENAKSTAQTIVSKQELMLNNELVQFYKNNEINIATQIFAIARKSIQDIADTSLEQLIIDKLINSISAISETDKSSVLQHLDKSKDNAIIRTAFTINSEMRSGIEQCLSKTFSKTITVSYEIIPQIICGIEIVIDGYKLSWCADDYLSRFKKAFSTLQDESMKNSTL